MAKERSAAGNASLRKQVLLVNVILGLIFITYAISDHPWYGGGPGFGLQQTMILVAGLILVALGFLLPARLGVRLFVTTLVGLLLLVALEIVSEALVGSYLRAPYEHDDRLLFRLRPGARSAYRLDEANGGGLVVHEINEDGFRGPPLDPSHERPRVMVYGDSFIHAAYTDEDATFVRRLGQSLEAKVGPVEVVNAGVSSYGPDQVLLRLEHDLDRYRPEAVVLAVFAGNDYGDLMRNKLFRISESGGLEATGNAVVEPAIRTSLDLNTRTSVFVKALRRILRPNDAGLPVDIEDPQAVLDFWLESARAEYQSFVIDADPVVTNTHMDYYSADLSLDPSSPSAIYKSKLMQLVIVEIHAMLEAAGVRSLLLVIPHPMDVAEDYEFTRVDGRYPNYDRRNLIKPLVEVAKSAAIPCVDLFKVYRAHGDPRALYLRGTDDHWNEEGQRVAAEAVAERIANLGLLEDVKSR